MDADILEGLPTLEESLSESLGEATSETTQEPTSDAVPATPVDAASVEPEPQVVAPATVEPPVVASEKSPVIEAAPAAALEKPPVAEAPPVAVSENPPVVEKATESVRPAVAAVAAAAVEAPAKEKGEVAKVSDDKSNSTPPAAGFQLPEGPRVDVSAATVARMMGIASTSDLRVIEGRVDLLTSKVAAILTKMDRCLSMFSSVPTASDIGRLEVQIAAVKSMMKELLDSVGAPVGGAKDQADKQVAAEQSRKLREGIKTNTES